MDEFIIKAINVLGVPGLITFCAYKLLSKWAAAFLEVHRAQATAITQLATSVRESSEGQRDVIMAVRVLTAKVEENTGYMKELCATCPGRAAAREGAAV